jgi:hypothetical protein
LILRRLSAGLLATAQEDSAEVLGVIIISLADVIKLTIGFQGALQGARTPWLTNP